MTGVAGYVGVEPDGLRALAAAVDAVESEMGYSTARIAALLDEAGESSAVAESLRGVADALNFASADMRGRAAIADEFAAIAATPRCVVPWWDPLRRASIAVASNVWNFGTGTFNSFVGSGSTVWRLTPVNGEWRQEWVDLAAGLRAAKEDWRGALDVATGMPDLEERGWSYWLGTVIPDLALTVAGGAGVANRVLKTVDTTDDVGDVATRAGKLRRLSAAAFVATKNGAVEGDYVHPSLFTRRAPDPEIEPVAKAKVLDADAASGGHSASRHGPETTLEQQRIRAETQVTPDGEVDRSALPGSRFFRWQDQAEAIERARVERQNGNKNKAIRVRFEHLVGEGYMPGGAEYRQTNVVTVQFDEHGDPFTAYPNIKVESG